MPGSLLNAPPLWLVPALPLLGFVLNGALALARPGAKRAVSLIGVGVLVLACAAAIGAVADFSRLPGAEPLVFRSWEWLPVGDLRVAFALLANEAVHSLPGNLPTVTGASHPVVLGTFVEGRQVR